MTVHPSRLVEQPNPAAASCHGKEAFVSWNAARKAIDRKRRVKRFRGDDIPVMEAYRCRECGGFHIAGRSA